MSKITDSAPTSVIATLAWCLAVSLANGAFAQDEFGNAPEEVDCCSQLHGRGSDSLRCRRIGGERCPSSLRVISVNQIRNIVVTVQNPAGKLGKGKNGLCVAFANAKTGKRVAMSFLRIDATLRFGHIEAARAVTETVPIGIGLYCVRVNLTLPGTWKLTFKCAESTKKEKLSLQPLRER